MWSGFFPPHHLFTGLRKITIIGLMCFPSFTHNLPHPDNPCLDGFEVKINFPFFKEFSNSKWDVKKTQATKQQQKTPTNLF